MSTEPKAADTVELSEDRAAPEFEQALEDLLNRLNRLMTEQ